MRTILFPHAAAAVVVTTIILLVYASVQQQYRTAANDPQIQIARDVAAKLKQQGPGAGLAPAVTVDLEQSLAPFIQVYDAKNTLVQSTGLSAGKAPVAPAGILAEAKKQDENIVTWQPLPGLRIAAVIEYTGVEQMSYVLVGRSLLEVEKRESVFVKMVCMCWLLCICVICCHGVLQAHMLKKEMAKS